MRFTAELQPSHLHIDKIYVTVRQLRQCGILTLMFFVYMNKDSTHLKMFTGAVECNFLK